MIHILSYESFCNLIGFLKTMPSVILNHTILKGYLNEKDSVSIDGTFVGDIKAEEIIIKDLGNINGNLNASVNIEVNGEGVKYIISWNNGKSKKNLNKSEAISYIEKKMVKL